MTCGAFRVHGAVLLAVLVLCPLAASPRKSCVPVQAGRLEALYRDLLDRYRSGDVEPVVREVFTWDRARLDALRSTKVVLPDFGFGQLGSNRSLLETAAALHTRVAVVLGEALTTGAPRDHLDLARQVVGRLATNSSSATFVRTWHVAVASYLAGGASPAAFLAHVVEVRRRYASDPGALLAVGIGYERIADSPLRPSTNIPDLIEPETNRPVHEEQPVLPSEIERARWLDLAASCYRRALGQMPNDGEARLRLGRILVLTGRNEEAALELARCEQQASVPSQRFLAALYLGTALDGRHRETEAVEAYRRARMLFPAARSSAFALSELLSRQGDIEEAAAVVDEIWTRQPPPRPDDDPWWTFQYDWQPRVEQALRNLDKAVGQ